MNTKSWLVPAASCVALFTGCATQTAHNEMGMIQPVMKVSTVSENPQGWYDLGRYYQGQERHDQAIAAFERAIAADPTLAEARNRLAVSYAEVKRYDEAIAQLEAAIRLAPNAAHLHSNLGYVLYLKGQYQAAIAPLQQALALDPGNARAQNNLGLAHAQLGEKLEAQMAFAQAARIVPAKGEAPSTEPAHEAVPSATPDRVLIPPAASRSEIVQVSPNVYELRPTALAVASPAVTAAAAPPPAPLASAKVEVSNGNGVSGMAKRVGGYLKEQGFAARRLTNQPTFTVTATRVEYRSGYEATARQVAATMPQPVEVSASTQLRQDIGVRVVLGKDVAGNVAYFEQKSASPTKLVQSRPEGS